MARNKEKDRENIKNACSAERRIPLQECVWALLLNDQDKLAKYRIIRRNLETKKQAALQNYDAAVDDDARLAVCAQLRIEESDVNPSAAEIAQERTAMLRER